jgi:arylsulfatase A-like enzyme
MMTGAFSLLPATIASPAKPIVILIVVDDLRPELHCHGVAEVVSPNFDRLAKKGMLCHNAYAQYPVCNPSRSSFLSGLRPDETGIVSNNVPFRAKLPDLVALPELFSRNGQSAEGDNPLPLRSDSLALSGASRRKQSPGSHAVKDRVREKSGSGRAAGVVSP